MFHSCFVKHGLNVFQSSKLLRYRRFFDVEFSILKRKVCDYLNPLENSVFQSPVSDFHFVKLNLTCFASINGL